MRHSPEDLKQLQSLPLDYKIIMTKQRIEAWYQTWTKFTIMDKETGKTRFVTIDARDFMWGDAKERFKLKDSEYIDEQEPGQVYVSFSGGKDSTVLKHIVDSMYNDVPALFVNTGLEYPEIQKFAMSQPNVITVRPEMRFDEVIKNYGYPVISKEVSKYIKEARRALEIGNTEYYAIQKLEGRLLDKDGNKSIYNCEKWGFMIDAPYKISSQCCDVMKKRPSKKYDKETGRKPMIATLATESRLRYQKWLKFGCNAFDQKRPTSQPLSFWTEQDILHYIKEYDVPYCSVYGDIQVKQEREFADQMNLIDYLGCYEPEDTLETTGCDRTGCIFCMFGCHLEEEPNRFQRLKETHPRQYEFCINGGEMVDGKWQPNKQGLGLGHVLDYIGVKYE